MEMVSIETIEEEILNLEKRDHLKKAYCRCHGDGTAHH